jgi:hypothetical protein
MNTIRVMARPERTNPTAHATKATHCKCLRYQTASRGASPTASFQFRRALPAPSHTNRIADYLLYFFYVCFALFLLHSDGVEGTDPQ